MSLTEFQLTDVFLKIGSSTSVDLMAGPMPEVDVFIKIQSSTSVDLVAGPTPEVKVIVAGNIGPPGPQGQWVTMTQAEYDALESPDSKTLYVIID